MLHDAVFSEMQSLISLSSHKNIPSVSFKRVEFIFLSIKYAVLFWPLPYNKGKFHRPFSFSVPKVEKRKLAKNLLLFLFQLLASASLSPSREPLLKGLLDAGSILGVLTLHSLVVLLELFGQGLHFFAEEIAGRRRRSQLFVGQFFQRGQGCRVNAKGA